MALVLHREWGWRGWISADRTWISASEHDFLSRIPCPLHTATRHSNHGVPKASFTVHQLVCSNDVTVTSRSFVRWPEQRYTRAGGSVDFVREIVFPCPKETFSRPAAIRYATTIPVVLTPCSLLHRERTNFLSLRSMKYPRPRRSMQNLYFRRVGIVRSLSYEMRNRWDLSWCAIIPFPLLRIIVSLET